MSLRCCSSTWAMKQVVMHRECDIYTLVMEAPEHVCILPSRFMPRAAHRAVMFISSAERHKES